MSNVRLSGVTKRFAGKPPTVAIDHLDLEVESGEFLVLLGPSGCGKTTTLRCLAGLETADEGLIELGGETVFDSSRRVNAPPDKRNVGLVFQSYALWPHLSVAKNIRYPLKARKVHEGISGGWVEQTASMVDCAHLLDRFPAQLSGGQQQRVALARGLVARPDLVLFDEPLSNLDAKLRDQVRSQLHELHGRLGFTAVFVTHDQSEALALADRIAIMRSGTIEQLAAPQDVFEDPATEYVAAFVGMENRLEFAREGDRWSCAGAAIDGLHAAVDEEVLVARVRPEDLQLVPRELATENSCVPLPAEVVDSTFGGRHIDVIAEVGTERVHARVPSGDRSSWSRNLRPGEPVTLAFHLDSARYFDTDGRRVESDKQEPVLR